MNVATILKLKGRDVVTSAPTMSLLDIAELLGSRGIGCVVIIEDDGKVAGIVSERDIVREIARAGSKVLKDPVENCMTKTVVTCRETDTIDELMAVMTARRFRHLPVVERGRLSASSRSATWCGCGSLKRRWKPRRCASTSPPAERLL